MRWGKAGRGVVGALVFAIGLACGGDDPRPPSLLLVTLDTLRADRVGCYGYARPTTPNLDALAREGVRYTRAYATSSWTLPAHASLFTGQYPWSHGARSDPEGPVALSDAIAGPVDMSAFRARGLAPGAHTLAQVLADAGFRTGAIVAGPWMKRVFGLDAGFAHYDDTGIDDVRGRLAEDVSDAALGWLDEAGDARFFLFLNYYDPHTPYSDPAGHAQRLAPAGLSLDDPAARRSKRGVDARYDGEIRYADEQLGRVLAALRARGRYDDTWVVVTSDHGELLGEHGRSGHGRSLYEEEIRIPLVVKPAPGARRGETDDRPIQLTHLFGLLASGLGVETGAGAPAREGGRAIYAEVYPLERRSEDGDFRTLRRGDWKLHWSSRGRHRLHDLAADPGERLNLVESDPERLASMLVELETFVGALPAPAARAEATEIDAATRDALRNLGYLTDGEPRSGTGDEAEGRPAVRDEVGQ